MKAFTFKRGIHPPHGKHFTENKQIEYLLPKGDLVFPLSQHIGAPCEPLVQKGDRVLLGQKIGVEKGFVSSPIHSSVSGTVKNIAPMLTAGGTKVMSIVIENDGLYEKHESLKPRESYQGMSKEELTKIIQEAGVVGMGGATFPTHVKLAPPPDSKIDRIIVNGAECEPFITSDYRVMLEESKRIIEGLKIVLYMFPEAKGYIGIEDNKPQAIEAMRNAARDEKNIEISVLQTKYPQGGEKQLIYAITGRKVPTGGLPSAVGCIVQNIETMVAIERAVLRGRPVMRRIVTVTGGAINEPKVFNVRIGTSFRELIEAAGGFKEDPVKIIAGGPMMGTTVSNIDIPVVKGTSSILCLTAKEAAIPDESNCIRCGKCVGACPMNLIPSTMNALALRNDFEMFEKYRGMDCIECGSCSFVCPAKRHLVQSFRTAKRTILANRKK
ncbi:electron transport complex subunit RnfC [Oxobacter pfennigii]|uniref:Ion-translocating oxidoreductase complex subunit C n=1 Tax=Oxobacter pfennigii TaxID=36849 RepID=A0A0P8W6Z4_9CLOT|nr:electron transport complex subunit RsxC [Oxobacter pfennigii]KPU43834.1 electron transport complex subunit RnfC [Oxobacter pfennigii]